MNAAILIVDDEQPFLDSVTRMLRIEGVTDIAAVADPREVPALIETRNFDAAFLDITMPELDGLDLLRIIKEKSPQTECIMVTANESIPMVIKAVRMGAYDYLVKPITPEEMIHTLDLALERKRLLESLSARSETAVRQKLDNPEAFTEFIHSDDKMRRILHEAELHAASDIPILVAGETGVGKEILARAIHQASRRAAGPFVPVNMLALSPMLFESEFFGHVRGAFTGADRDRTGYLAQAKGGTLFLDEIGDLPMEIQGKLLRILQEGEYVPVGRTKAETADVRFVAATNQDLARLVQQGKFRKDLFYRLQFAHLYLPPLRERKNDILLLSAKFLSDLGRPDLKLTDEAEKLLLAHDWPGNVRELKAVLESAANLSESGDVKKSHLRLTTARMKKTVPDSERPPVVIEALADVERRHILDVYQALGRNKSRTANALEIGLQTLHRKLKEYGVK